MIINLTGQGTSPQIAISPLMIDFGNLLLNTSASAQQVTVTNSGSATLSLTSIALGGAMAASFTLGNLPALPVLVTPNQSAIFTVTATPAHWERSTERSRSRPTTRRFPLRW